jgi:hypothetical protein
MSLWMKAAAVVLAAAAGSGCGPAASPGGEAGTRAADAPFAPITYFDDSCSRCHGAYGSAFDHAALRRMDDRRLRQVLHEMTRGPARAPLETPAAMEALAAFHRSLTDDAPFVAVTKQTPASIEGEVTPKASVAIHVSGEVIPAEVTGHRWRVQLPPAGVTDPPALKVIATINGHTTSLEAAPGRVSHDQ